MRGGNVTTKMDRTLSTTPDMRTLAIEGLIRRGASDLLDMLGLAQGEEPLVIDGRICCPSCQGPYSDDGRRACRRTSCELGPKARGVKA